MPVPRDARRSRARLRWLRDRARVLVASGLAVYACGFFLWWIFDLEGTWVFTLAGAALGLTGVAAGFLWLVDPSQDPDRQGSDP